MSQPNLFAGMGSHQSAKSETNTWLTPLRIIESLGPFDLDPCGLQWWKTAKTIFELPMDGLKKKWFGRVWLNPPYTTEEIRQWMHKLKEHGSGTALIFARTETRHWFESIWNDAYGILFVKGRINFHNSKGLRAKTNAGAPSALVAYGESDFARLVQCGIQGKLVRLIF